MRLLMDRIDSLDTVTFGAVLALAILLAVLVLAMVGLAIEALKAKRTRRFKSYLEDAQIHERRARVLSMNQGSK